MGSLVSKAVRYYTVAHAQVNAQALRKGLVTDPMKGGASGCQDNDVMQLQNFSHHEHHAQEDDRRLQVASDGSVVDVLHTKENFNLIICPFLSTLIKEGVLPPKAEYTREELMKVTIEAGLDPVKAKEHVASNFKHFPSGVMDIYKMTLNEHDFSTKTHDCSTLFADCSVDAGGIGQCMIVDTKHCVTPNADEFLKFWDAVDANKDGKMTRSELKDAVDKNLIEINDANPIGLGTIIGSHNLIIDIFGETQDSITFAALQRVFVHRIFPLHYSFKPADVIVDVLQADPAKHPSRTLRQVANMWDDTEGADHPVIMSHHGYRRRYSYFGSPSGLEFDGTAVKLQGQLLQIANHEAVNFGHKSFTIAVWANLHSIAHPASSVIMKKGTGMFFPAGTGGFTAGWEIAVGVQNGDGSSEWIFHDQGIAFTARDQDSTVEDGKKCAGLLKFDDKIRWSSTLNMWNHIAVVFDRKVDQAVLYWNGRRQQEPVSLANCTGSWDNAENIHIGTYQGWSTFGSLRALQIFAGVAKASQIADLASQI